MLKAEVFAGENRLQDNVRKYWEDYEVKQWLRPAVERLLARRGRLRVADLECRAGDGPELLTHISASDRMLGVEGPFVLGPERIESRTGMDVTAVLKAQTPFDVYYSAHGALSRLTAGELEELLAGLIAQGHDGSVIVLDVLGRYSPEWPEIWTSHCGARRPYTAAYLLPLEQQVPGAVAWCDATYWNSQELESVVERAAERVGRAARVELHGRSLLVGRHMDTSLFKEQRFQLREEVNRMLGGEFGGETDPLKVDLSYLCQYAECFPEQVGRLTGYSRKWNMVVGLMESLQTGRTFEDETDDALLNEGLETLRRLYQENQGRPAAELWGKVMGPRAACLLRDIEMALGPGLGCGHGLWGMVEVG